VIGRKEKSKNAQEEEREKNKEKRDEIKKTQERRDKEGERTEKNKEERAIDRRKTSLQALKRRLPKGGSVLLELWGGTQQEYQDVLKKCQDKIKLDEMGIPPI